ncbi:MAG: hypothetical protein V4505_18945 [Pseudomonadota bacterium]
MAVDTLAGAIAFLCPCALLNAVAGTTIQPGSLTIVDTLLAYTLWSRKQPIPSPGYMSSTNRMSPRPGKPDTCRRTEKFHAAAGHMELLASEPSFRGLVIGSAIRFD